ncbi:hypothetical protein ACIQU6_06360 [Streptomyces sp. NPDC090442]|uniref:hypothetical protein n=1 Tax=Streptomyces sp. NPDC090442 TaxID=3365962 RepID=UPI003816A7DE
MSEPAVHIDSLPDAVAALLRAIHDAVDIPLPDVTDVDEHAHAKVLQSRSAGVRIALAGVLFDDHEVGCAAEWLCGRTAREPVDYTPWPDDGGTS